MITLEFRPRQVIGRFGQCLLVLTLFAAMPLLAHGATYYVNKSGRDSNTCAQATSRSTAKLTISSSLACLSGGDILIIGDGTYVESIYNTIPPGRAGAPTVVRAENRNQVILKPITATPNEYVLQMSGVSYITLDGLVGDAADLAAGAVFGCFDLPCHNIIIQNSTARNGRGTYGSGIDGHYVDSYFLNNEIYSNGSGPLSYAAHGVYLYLSGNIVDGNRIHGNSGYGVHLNSGANTTNNNIIRNNIIYSQVLRGGIVLNTGTNNIAFNNIIYSNSLAGIVIRGPGSQQVYNNTIYGNRGFAILLDSFGPGSIMRNNIFYMNETNGIENTNSVSFTASHNLTSNPLFANAPEADFSLLSNSAAIGTGMNLSNVFTTDLVGKVREGTAWDVGALGYLPASAPVAPAPPTNLRIVGAQ